MPYSDSGSAASLSSHWDKRVARALELARRFAVAGEVLAFYSEVLQFQRRIYAELASRAPSPVTTDEPFRSLLDQDDALRHLPALLSLIQEKGTPKLAEEAAAVRAMPREQQLEMLQRFLAGEKSANTFFARALLQPYAEMLAQSRPTLPPATTVSACPRCGSPPQAAVLHPEGEGGKRFLLCSLCLTEWEFRRILCPVCGEEDYRKLPRYSAGEHDSARVEACDTCHFYLKSIDMTIDGLAVPLVDEVATVLLDLWASEHGYKKPEPNLMGF